METNATNSNLNTLTRIVFIFFLLIIFFFRLYFSVEYWNLKKQQPLHYCVQPVQIPQPTFTPGPDWVDVLKKPIPENPDQ